jgi:hypothetical protein
VAHGVTLLPLGHSLLVEIQDALEEKHDRTLRVEHSTLNV